MIWNDLTKGIICLGIGIYCLHLKFKFPDKKNSPMAGEFKILWGGVVFIILGILELIKHFSSS